VDAAELIAAIVDDPQATERWAVYADWLLDRGDPRGELISLELAIEAGTADDEAKRRVDELRRDPLWLLSPRLADLTRYWELEFRRGFVRRARLISLHFDRITSTAAVVSASSLFIHPCDLEMLEWLVENPTAVAHLEKLEMYLGNTDVAGNEVADLCARLRAALPRTQLVGAI
jgi:uncharacterized protein (TIGR02996 family)